MKTTGAIVVEEKERIKRSTEHASDNLSIKNKVAKKAQKFTLPWRCGSVSMLAREEEPEE